MFIGRVTEPEEQYTARSAKEPKEFLLTINEDSEKLNTGEIWLMTNVSTQ